MSLVVVVARVVPKLAWKPAVVAVAVLAALWPPGAVTLWLVLPAVITSHCRSYGYEYHPAHVREAGRQR